ncbi:hypothetical protein [Brevibacillus parabrevis]|uniref:hypothetical protein n=1 Tax=Brevibacillus parabrevis TaxID=54914 RepID=UPI001F61094A|nr:hypothetical protein [Brevibacillus parabrevis]MDR5001338.1 hypothetical protein [Brevibacillus parabrevis]
MEKKLSIILGFIVGLVFVNFDFDYSFLLEMNIDPAFVRAAVKTIGFVGALFCGLTLLFDAWKAIRSS